MSVDVFDEAMKTWKPPKPAAAPIVGDQPWMAPPEPEPEPVAAPTSKDVFDTAMKSWEPSEDVKPYPTRYQGMGAAASITEMDQTRREQVRKALPASFLGQIEQMDEPARRFFYTKMGEAIGGGHPLQPAEQFVDEFAPLQIQLQAMPAILRAQQLMTPAKPVTEKRTFRFERNRNPDYMKQMAEWQKGDFRYRSDAGKPQMSTLEMVEVGPDGKVIGPVRENLPPHVEKMLSRMGPDLEGGWTLSMWPDPQNPNNEGYAELKGPRGQLGILHDPTGLIEGGWEQEKREAAKEREAEKAAEAYYKRLGKIGFWETLGQKWGSPGAIIERLPFVRELPELYRIQSTMDAIGKLGSLTEDDRALLFDAVLDERQRRTDQRPKLMSDKEYEDIEKRAAPYHAAADYLMAKIIKERERSARGTTILAEVANAVSDMPAWALELALTWGAAAAARRGLTRGVARAGLALGRKRLEGFAARRAALSLARRTLLGRAGRFAAKIAGYTVANPQQVIRSYAQRRLPGYDVDERGRLQISPVAETPVKSALMALADVAVAVGSEMSGEIVGAQTSKVLQRLGTRFPKSVGAVNRFLRAFSKKMPGFTGASGKAFKLAQFHGTLEEMSEEQIEATIRAVTGLDEQTKGQPLADQLIASIEGGRDLLAQFLSFGLYGAGNMAAARMSKEARARRRARRDEMEYMEFVSKARQGRRHRQKIRDAIPALEEMTGRAPDQWAEAITAGRTLTPQQEAAREKRINSRAETGTRSARERLAARSAQAQPGTAGPADETTILDQMPPDQQQAAAKEVGEVLDDLTDGQATATSAAVAQWTRVRDRYEDLNGQYEALPKDQRTPDHPVVAEMEQIEDELLAASREGEPFVPPAEGEYAPGRVQAGPALGGGEVQVEAATTEAKTRKAIEVPREKAEQPAEAPLDQLPDWVRPFAKYERQQNALQAAGELTDEQYQEAMRKNREARNVALEGEWSRIDSIDGKDTGYWLTGPDGRVHTIEGITDDILGDVWSYKIDGKEQEVLKNEDELHDLMNEVGSELEEQATDKPSPPAEAEGGKQPWEMTRADYVGEGYIPNGKVTDLALKRQVNEWQRRVDALPDSEGAAEGLAWATRKWNRANEHRDAVREHASEAPRPVLEEYRGEKWADEALAKTGRVEEADAAKLFDEYQSLAQTLPTNIGKAKAEGKLSKKQLESLDRINEIEGILGQDRLRSMTQEAQEKYKAKLGQWRAKNRAEAEKRVTEAGFAEGQEVELVAPVLGGIGGAVSYRGRVKIGTNGSVYVSSRRRRYDLFKNPWQAVEGEGKPSAPAREKKGQKPAEPIARKRRDTAADKKRAARFRKFADGMQKQIDDRRREMTQNPTPKRMKEYRSRLHDAANMERAQQAMRAMADALEAGTLPAILADLKTKADVAPLVSKGLEGGGYYDVIESRDYSNTTEKGKALQQLMEAAESGEDAAARAEREKAEALQRMEDDLRFKPIPGFFPTPAGVVSQMLDAADIKPGMSVLEPSAGKGDIADAIKEQGVEPDVVEVMPALRSILEAKGYKLAGSDFLEHEGQYDRIVMNPPFEKGQDIEHVRHAYDLLKPGGKLVAIMSEGSFGRSDKKATAFREWMDDVGGDSEKLPAKAFTGPEAFRQTGVSARMVTIEKPSRLTNRTEIPADTPAMRQYKAFKEKYPDHILLFRLGDFYEMFGDDAKTAAKVLGLALTDRKGVPLAGVPAHAIDGYLAKLIKAGHRVAIAEPVADSEKGKVPKREVTRLVQEGGMVDAGTQSSVASPATWQDVRAIMQTDQQGGVLAGDKFYSQELAVAGQTYSWHIAIRRRKGTQMGTSRMIYVDGPGVPGGTRISMGNSDLSRRHINHIARIIYRAIQGESEQVPAKKAWEMSQYDYAVANAKAAGAGAAVGMPKFYSGEQKRLNRKHERLVKKAIADGENVSDEALTAYRGKPWADAELAKREKAKPLVAQPETDITAGMSDTDKSDFRVLVSDLKKTGFAYRGSRSAKLLRDEPGAPWMIEVGADEGRRVHPNTYENQADAINDAAAWIVGREIPTQEGAAEAVEPPPFEYTRQTPKPGMPEREKLDQEYEAVDRLVKEAWAAETAAEKARDKSRAKYGGPTWAKLRKKASDAVNARYAAEKTLKPLKAQHYLARLEDAHDNARDDAQRIGLEYQIAEATHTGEQTRKYQREQNQRIDAIAAIVRAEAKRQGATDKEADSAASALSVSIATYPLSDTYELVQGTKTAVAVAQRNEWLLRIRRELSGLKHLSQNGWELRQYERKLDNVSVFDKADAEAILEEAKAADAKLATEAEEEAAKLAEQKAAREKAEKEGQKRIADFREKQKEGTFAEYAASGEVDINDVPEQIGKLLGRELSENEQNVAKAAFFQSAHKMGSTLDDPAEVGPDLLMLIRDSSFFKGPVRRAAAEGLRKQIGPQIVRPDKPAKPKKLKKEADVITLAMVHAAPVNRDFAISGFMVEQNGTIVTTDRSRLLVIKGDANAAKLVEAKAGIYEWDKKTYRPMEGNFPKYTDVVPRDVNVRATVSGEDAASISRAIGKTMRLNAMPKSGGEQQATVVFRKAGPEGEDVGLNAAFLADAFDALSALGADEITIGFNKTKEMAPVLLDSSVGQAVIMPYELPEVDREKTVLNFEDLTPGGATRLNQVGEDDVPGDMPEPPEPRAAADTQAPLLPDVALQGPITRDNFRDAIQQAYGLDNDMADAVAALTDARAKTWAAETGRKAEDWYTTHIAAVQAGGEPGAGALSGGDQSGYNYVVFDENAVSIEEHTLFQKSPEVADPFYSRLRQVIGEKMQGPMPARQLRSMLDKAGVKADEMGWSGMDDLLRKGGKLTPDQVMAHLDANAARIEEVVHGGVPDPQLLDMRARDIFEDMVNRRMDELADEGQYPDAPELEVFESDDEDGGWEATVDGENLGYVYDTEDEASIAAANEANALRERAEKDFRIEVSNSLDYQDALDQAQQEWEEVRPNTQYDDYQLPGGENYRELLLTLPGEPPAFRRAKADLQAALDAEREAERQGIDVMTRGDITDRTDHAQAAVDRMRAGGISFRSGHWDEPNVLAHVRFNERTDAEGKKVLLIEEVQSDWHQKGREQGYRGELPDTTGWVAREIPTSQADLPRMRYGVQDAGNNARGSLSAYLAESPEAAIRMAAADEAWHNVPQAPFKKTWPDLALKRMLRWAAENGFDRIAWTTGQQQAERYSLAKVADRIDYDPDTKRLYVYRDGSLQVDPIDIPSEQDLFNQVGKEVGQRLLESEPVADAVQGRMVHRVEGEGLEVGGHGMKAFYDNILVNAANKIGKKFGSRVGETTIRTMVPTPDGEMAAVTDVHSLDITDELRDSAMRIGFPLFQHNKGAVEPLADGRVILHAFQAADVSTAVHELAHVFRRDLSGGDLSAVEEWAGVEHGTWRPEHEEKFARGFERYLADGRAPTTALKKVFAAFKRWLKKIYGAITQSAIDIRISPEVRRVFDRLLGADHPAAKLARSVENASTTSPFKNEAEILATASGLVEQTGGAVGPWLTAMMREFRLRNTPAKKIPDLAGIWRSVKAGTDVPEYIREKMRDSKYLDRLWDRRRNKAMAKEHLREAKAAERGSARGSVKGKLRRTIEGPEEARPYTPRQLLRYVMKKAQVVSARSYIAGARGVVADHRELEQYARQELKGLPLSEAARNYVLHVIARSRTRSDYTRAVAAVDILRDVLQRKQAIARLRKIVPSNTDLWHMRPEFRDRIAALIDSIGIGRPSEAKMSAIQDRLASLEATETEKDDPQHEMIRQQIEIARRLLAQDQRADAKLLTPDAINAVADAIAHLIHLNRFKNELIFGARREKNDKVATAGADAINGRGGTYTAQPGQARSPRPPGAVAEFVHNDLLKPETKALRLAMGDESSPVYDILWNRLFEADREHLGRMQAASDWVRDEFRRQTGSDLDIELLNEWSTARAGWKGRGRSRSSRARTVTVQLPEAVTMRRGRRGKRVSSIELTKAERTWLLAALDDPFVLKAIVRNRGAPVSMWYDLNAPAIKLSARDVYAIRKSATAEERALAQIMRRYVNEVQRAALNKASVAEVGYEIARQKDHWSIRRNLGQEQKGELTNFQNVGRAVLENLGILQRRTGGNRPIIIEDVFTGFQRNVAQASAFIHKAQAIRNARMLLGHPDFKTAAANRYGAGALKDFEAVLQEWSGLAQRETGTTERYAMMALRRAHKGLLGLKISVMLNQILSYGTAATEMNLRDLGRFWNFRLPSGALREKLWRSPILRERMMGSGLQVISPMHSPGSALDAFYGGQVEDVGPLVGKVPGLAWLSEKSMSGIHFFDMMAIGNIYQAAESESKRKGLTGGELIQAALRRTEEVVSRTQPVWDVLHQSGLQMRGKRSFWAALAVLFSSQRNQNLNIIARALIKGGAVEMAKKFLLVAITQWFGYAVLRQLRTFALNGFNPDDDRNTFTQLGIDTAKSAASSLYVVGDFAAEAIDQIAAKLQGRQAWDLQNPLASAAKDVTLVLADLADAIQNANGERIVRSGKYRGTSRRDRALLRAVRRAIRTSGPILGMPTQAMEEYYRAAAKATGGSAKRRTITRRRRRRAVAR